MQLLQSLDVGVFKGFKENFHKTCHHLCKGGRVITDQGITDLVAEAWPMSMMPANFMSGFKSVAFFRSILASLRWKIACSK